MNRTEIEAAARKLAVTEDLAPDVALERVVSALPPSERANDAIKNHSPVDEDIFDFAAQYRLFTVGMYGQAVTIWSESKGEAFPYPAMCLELEPGVPLVVNVDGNEPDKQLQFAAAYITGWVESQGGSLQDLRIWLQPEQGEQS